MAPHMYTHVFYLVYPSPTVTVQGPCHPVSWLLSRYITPLHFLFRFLVWFASRLDGDLRCKSRAGFAPWDSRLHKCY